MHCCTILEIRLAYIDTDAKMFGIVSDRLSKHLDRLPLLKGIAGFEKEWRMYEFCGDVKHTLYLFEQYFVMSSF